MDWTRNKEANLSSFVGDTRSTSVSTNSFILQFMSICNIFDISITIVWFGAFLCRLQHGGRKTLNWSYLQHGVPELNPIRIKEHGKDRFKKCGGWHGLVAIISYCFQLYISTQFSSSIIFYSFVFFPSFLSPGLLSVIVKNICIAIMSTRQNLYQMVHIWI